jgi:hypothetical protein
LSINAEEAAIRTVILGALMGHSEAGDRSMDTVLAMRQAETIVKALKVCGHEIRKISIETKSDRLLGSHHAAAVTKSDRRHRSDGDGSPCHTI